MKTKKEEKVSIHDETLAALPEKARKSKNANDIQVAKYAREYQDDLYIKNGKRGSRAGLPLILEVKTLWETGAYTTDEMAEIVGKGAQTVRSIVAALNKTQFRSPMIKALAIKATKQILKECPDDNIRLKMISKIFPDEQIQHTGSGVSVNLNIKGSELAPKNPDFDFEDVDTY
jgi:hypothetical protein